MKKLVSLVVTFVFAATLVLAVVNTAQVETKVSNEKHVSAIFPFPPPIPKKKDD